MLKHLNTVKSFTLARAPALNKPESPTLSRHSRACFLAVVATVVIRQRLHINHQWVVRQTQRITKGSALTVLEWGSIPLEILDLGAPRQRPTCLTADRITIYQRVWAVKVKRLVGVSSLWGARALTPKPQSSRVLLT